MSNTKQMVKSICENYSLRQITYEIKRLTDEKKDKSVERQAELDESIRLFVLARGEWYDYNK